MPIDIIIAGATGRFGSLLREVADADPDVKVVGLVSSRSPLKNCVKPGAVVIDFTLPVTTIEHARLAAEHRMPLVVATTGLKDAEMNALHAAAKVVPIVQTPNTSVAITLLAKWLEQVAPLLGGKYSTSIEETHHVAKKDAPSGTALRLAHSIAAGCSVDVAKIPIKSHREGDVVGTHVVTFKGPYDTLTLTHTATDRCLFCEGALRAAKWVVHKPAGLYTMEDVLCN